MSTQGEVEANDDRDLDPTQNWIRKLKRILVHAREEWAGKSTAPLSARVRTADVLVLEPVRRSLLDRDQQAASDCCCFPLVGPWEAKAGDDQDDAVELECVQASIPIYSTAIRPLVISLTTPELPYELQRERLEPVKPGVLRLHRPAA
jgi:hypothetical protein